MLVNHHFFRQDFNFWGVFAPLITLLYMWLKRISKKYSCLLQTYSPSSQDGIEIYSLSSFLSTSWHKRWVGFKGSFLRISIYSHWVTQLEVQIVAYYISNNSFFESQRSSLNFIPTNNMILFDFEITFGRSVIVYFILSSLLILHIYLREIRKRFCKPQSWGRIPYWTKMPLLNVNSLFWKASLKN